MKLKIITKELSKCLEEQGYITELDKMFPLVVIDKILIIINKNCDLEFKNER